MRKFQARWCPRGEWMIYQPNAIKYSTVFVVTFDSVDAIHVKRCSVCGKAGPNGRVRVVSSPIQDFRETSPVWFVGQVLRQRLSSGHNQTVEFNLPQILNT